MIGLRDCLERSLTGPVMRERDFDLAFARKLRELYADCGITPDPYEVVPTDATADLIFAAAVELLAETGLYNKDSQRVIRLTQGEILEVAASRESQIEIGTGNERVTVRERKPESEFPPVIVTGPVGGPFTEQIYLPCHRSYAQEPTCQGLLGGVLVGWQGVENMASRPNELIVTAAESGLIARAAAEAGKPGLYLGPFPPGGISTGAIFCNHSAAGLDPARTQIPIQLMPELKLDWSKLDLAFYCQAHGLHPWTDIVSVIGAFCRNSLESSISQTAGILGAWSFTGGSTASVWTTDIEGLCTRKRNLWTNCATTRALERNVGNPVFLLGYASAGPCTEMALLETAAYSVAYTASGGELIWGGSTCNGVDVDAYAGLQGRMVGETARASCAVGTNRANEIISKLFATYEEELPKAPKGKTFPQCYDLKTIKPSGEYQRVYSRTKERLSAEFDINYQD
ncbi:MAG TPA: monomethylamine:corrinoid methyltransferase [Thermoleophilia bacterium]|nr:monomethylamine:corrinoid methyltransferase [Thermoleophilia bacterium]